MVGAFDGPAEQVDLFVATRADGQVHEAPLDLRPLVARFARKTMGVLLECLMQDTDDDESFVAAERQFGHLLKKVEVGPLMSSGFQELAHLVDEHHQSPAGTRIARRDLFERLQEMLLVPRLRWFAGQEAGCLDSFTDDVGRAFAPADNRENAPSSGTGRQGGLNDVRGLLPEDCRGTAPEPLVAMQQRAQRDGQTRLAAAVRAGPGERPLAAFGHVAGHGGEDFGR